MNALIEKWHRRGKQLPLGKHDGLGASSLLWSALIAITARKQRFAIALAARMTFHDQSVASVDFAVGTC